jgi:TorA maturation chaperone TorD
MAAQAQVSEERAVATALGRSAVYRFLSLVFLPVQDDPDGLAREGTEALGVLRRMASDGRAVPLETVEKVAALLHDDAGPALREEYYRTFGHQIANDCPLHETQYGAGHVFQQAQQLADIAGFYRAFGLEVADGAGERVDHLSLELEFMHVLTYREAYARLHHGADRVAQLREAQQAFLRDHLSRWVSVLARLVGRKTQEGYRHLVDLAAAWVAVEATALGLPAAEEVEYQPEPPLDPAESMPSCGLDPGSLMRPP